MKKSYTIKFFVSLFYALLSSSLIGSPVAIDEMLSTIEKVGNEKRNFDFEQSSSTDFMISVAQIYRLRLSQIAEAGDFQSPYRLKWKLYNTPNDKVLSFKLEKVKIVEAISHACLQLELVALLSHEGIVFLPQFVKIDSKKYETIEENVYLLKRGS